MRYSAYLSRKNTDKLFVPEEGSASFDGAISELIDYVESEQLTDPALWSLFVEQFRVGNVDDFDKGWRCEYWGKMMRGACFTFSCTQNPALYKTLEGSVRELLTTQDSSGRFSTYSIENELHGWDLWGRKYVMLGFRYFLEICRDDSLADEIIKAMRAHADCIMQKIGNDSAEKIPVTSASEWWGGLNASSILEPFVHLYTLTADKKYLDFSKEIIAAGGTEGFNIFEAAFEGKLYPYEYPVTKAYEMMSNFEGIIEYYRATGEAKYLTMAVNFARLVIESDITVIGSAGTTHELFDHSRIRQFNPEFNGIMQETCVTVTWMKLCHQLLCLTGEPKYAEQIELSLYNALAGAVNVGKNPSECGQVFTFDSYSPLLNGIRGRRVGGCKDIIKNSFYWGCCVAIGAAGTGLIGMTAAMPAKDGVAVNLFIPGKYTAALPDGSVTLKTKTEYPKGATVTIEVGTDSEKPFSVYVRIPKWSESTSLSVNGKPIDTQPGEYSVINREWSSGDIIELSLDMRTRIIRASEIDPNANAESVCHAALRRGPVMLAVDSRFGTDLEKAVVLSDFNGYAQLTEGSETPFRCSQHYRVSLADGEYLDVADYASCGQTWEKDKPMSVWITTK